tara:strand:- start:2 stop:508 length:507 start_codon:yes stop_codon:yes gene_type:complete
MRRIYLIGIFVIAGLLFFIIDDNFGDEDSKSFTNAVRPTAFQIAGFALGDDEPFLAVNLLTFKDKAEYEDGRETKLSGKEAYAIYADEVVDHLAKVGAEPILAGDVQRLILGEVEELWDVVAIVRYPSRKAMYEMATNKEYMESEKHREAGLAGQLNIEIKDSNEFNF